MCILFSYDIMSVIKKESLHEHFTAEKAGDADADASAVRLVAHEGGAEGSIYERI